MLRLARLRLSAEDRALLAERMARRRARAAAGAIAPIKRLKDERPALAEMFMTYLLSRNIQIEADLVDRLFNSSERRLARMLLLLGHFGKEGKIGLLPVSRTPSLGVMMEPEVGYGTKATWA